MSDLAPPYRSSAGRSSVLALGLALAAVATWLAAASGIDELWFGAAFVGLVAAGLARRARRAGGKRTLALVALILGGLVAAQVIAFVIGWGIYHVAT
jgi:hypothetical protein